MEKVPETILVDRRNFSDVYAQILVEMKVQGIKGLDIETTNAFAHPGILKLETKKTIFDIRRTVITGFSVYTDGSDHCWYFNLFHADEENRLRWEEVRPILQAPGLNPFWVIHNAPFEITMFQQCLGFGLGTNVICSLQLCVTAYSPDTYPKSKFMSPDIGGLAKIMPTIARAFASFRKGDAMTAEQEELLYKVIAKESDAEHSYNGYVKSMAYGYGLKQAVKSWFGYDMMPYDALLKACGADRMCGLTGDQVADYGCDDAYWCVRLYKRVMQYLMDENPAAVETFFIQENPMVHEYAAIWQGGLRVNKANIIKRMGMERAEAANQLRLMKAAVRQLDFELEPHEKLMKYDAKWYEKNYQKYRTLIEQWAGSPDEADDFKQVMQVRSPTSAGWAADKGVAESKGVNLNHYMPMRLMLYDLCGLSFQLADGKVQSDDEARKVMLRRYAKKWCEEKGVALEKAFDVEKLKVLSEPLRQEPVVQVMLAYMQLAGIEQRMKLYLTPYLLMVDPETDCMYPVLSSRLATRRTSCQYPNGQQLAKYGGSAYVRGFYMPDEDDHVLVSADWSAIELAIVAQYSLDPAFLRAYGQRPHDDLHSWTAAQMMRMPSEEFNKHPDKKQLRTDLGKGKVAAPCGREAA